MTPTGIDCECVEGFVLNEKSDCVEIDECATDTHYCGKNAECINRLGTFECTCNSGFHQHGLLCYDISECAIGEHNCNTHAECTNTEGSFTCSCKKGFEGDGFICSDKDQCSSDAHICNTATYNSTCVNTIGSYQCLCGQLEGFAQNGTLSCSEVDECASNIHDCPYHASCTNTIGSFSCSCDKEDGKSCRLEAMLVLNTKTTSAVPLVIDGKGQSRKTGIKFIGDTEAHASCSVVWKGKMYLFGGTNHNYQISVVDQCQVKLIDKHKLEFYMDHGACAQRHDAEVFICFEDFNQDDKCKNCYRSKSPFKKFKKMPSTSYNHGGTHIAVTSGKLEFDKHGQYDKHEFDKLEFDKHGQSNSLLEAFYTKLVENLKVVLLHAYFSS